MNNSENNIREAIARKDDNVISCLAKDYAENKLAMFTMDIELKTMAVNTAVNDCLKQYKRFPLKKKWAKAIPYITQIIEGSIASSIHKALQKKK